MSPDRDEKIHVSIKSLLNAIEISQCYSVGQQTLESRMKPHLLRMRTELNRAMACTDHDSSKEHIKVAFDAVEKLEIDMRHMFWEIRRT